MRIVLVGLLLLASPGALHCSTMTHVETITEETLRRLSLSRESFVNEELKKAPHSVEQMKEVMEENGEEHKSLMKSLRNSMRDFFQRVTWIFGPQQSSAQHMILNQSLEDADMEVTRMEDSFSRRLDQMKALYDGSLLLVTKLHKHLGEAFQAAFAVNNSQIPTAAPDALDTSFFEGISLEDILESFFDFGRSIYQELSSMTKRVFDMGHEPVEGMELPTETAPSSSQLPQTQQLCRDLRRQTSECWRLQARCEACQSPSLRECPDLGELRVKLSEVSHLLDLSREHYQEVWQIIQRHVAKTLDWLRDMAAGLGWVSGASRNDTAKPENIFHVMAVVPPVQMGGDASGGGTIVGVNILNCPTLTLVVPSKLELQDLAFIQYVAQEAIVRCDTVVQWLILSPHIFECSDKMTSDEMTSNEEALAFPSL